MQSVHESFTNTDLTRFVEDPRVLAVISRIGLRRQAFTNYEFHESHELIIMTTNLTNWLVAQGRIMGTGFWISGDRQVVFEKQPVPRDPKTCPRDSSSSCSKIIS